MYSRKCRGYGLRRRGARAACRPARARAEDVGAPLGVLTAFDIHRAEQLGVVGRVHQERADHDPQLVKRIGQGGIERGGQQVNERLEGPIDGGIPGN
jgi:hypothetical protein